MSTPNGHRDRDDLGRFAAGNKVGPGRPRRVIEQDYLTTLTDVVSMERWRRIAERAVEDAERGDPKARRWISELLIGRQPESLTALAVQEMAGTLDQTIQVQAAGLRESVLRQGFINGVSKHPDLDPGRPLGSAGIERGLPDLHIDVEAPRPGRNGHPG
jgi:hypothetical protein